MTRLFRPTLAALLLAAPLPACARPAPAAPKAGGPALWLVKDADTTIYLFGTIHVLKPGLPWFGGPVKAAFDKADEVKLEIVEPDPAAMSALVVAKGLGAPGTTLTAKLPPRERPALATYMGQIGVAPATYDRFQPWLAASYLQVQSLGKVGYDPTNGPEQVITDAAKASGKPVTGLETVEQQIGFFAGLSDKAQVAMLDETLDEMPKLKSEMGRMVDEWAAGKTDLIAHELNEGVVKTPETMRVLLLDRNRRWADWIKTRLATPGTVFIAVGAGHLAGTTSVQADLAKLGVKAVRVVY